MTEGLVKQSIAELQDLVRCRCRDAYKVRGLHDPGCECDSADAVQVVADRIEELEAKLAKAVEGFEDLARLGNGDRYGNSLGNLIAQEYIAEITGGKDD